MNDPPWWRVRSAPAGGPDSWPAVARFAFRALLIFSLLRLGAPSPLDLVPGVEGAADPLLRPAAIALGHALGLRVPTHSFAGSSDTLQDWLTLGAVSGVAVAGAALWSVLARAPARHEKLLDFLRLYVRVALSQQLFVYGAIKVLALQFPAPGPDRLLSTYAQSSPMGLMWTFMGASTGYQHFGGWMEVLPAVLLCFQRTTALGALLATAVMTNVFAMNLCYDVPVKLHSGTLLLASVFLVSFDARRLLDGWVLNRPVPPADLAPTFWAEGRWWRLRQGIFGVFIAAGVLKIGLIVAGGPPRERPGSMSGAYEVTESVGVEGVARFAFSAASGSVIFSDGRSLRLGASQQLPEHQVELTSRAGEPAFNAVLVRKPGPTPGTFTFAGTWRGAAVTLEARAIDLTQSELNGRGFHWVNEAAVNR